MKVYLKTTSGGLWEKKPALAMILSIIIGCVFFFGAIFVLAALRAPTVVMVVVLMAIFAGMVAVPIYMNAQNQSKNLGFILDDSGLYMVKLGFQKAPEHTVINTPGAPLVQAVLLPNNIKAAKETLSAAKELEGRRVRIQTYADAVAQMKADHTKLPTGVCEFGFMLRPKVEKETKGKIWISFDQEGKRVMRAFPNVYAELANDLKALEPGIGPTEAAVPMQKSAEEKKADTRAIILLVVGLVAACVLKFLGLPLAPAFGVIALLALLLNKSSKKK